LLDRKIGGVPTLTQVVPVYEEQVILTEEFLCASDGRNTNLGFVISQDAWLQDVSMGSAATFMMAWGCILRILKTYLGMV
jgi:hypothetical protein